MAEPHDSHWLIRFFEDQIGPGKRFSSRVDMAHFLGLPPSKASRLFNFLNGRDTQYSAVLEWFARLGGSLTPPDGNPARSVCFVDARLVPSGEQLAPPQAEDYMAVPLVEEVGAGPGMVPQGKMLSWFLVYKHQDAVRYRRDLIAVQIGRNSTSMLPTLAPRDIVLVDRQDRDVRQPGRIMLVMDEEGSGMIKRVAVEEVNGGKDWRIMYYSDNAAENPPMLYSLKSDFLGDWDRAVVGRVVWAWSDISHK